MVTAAIIVGNPKPASRTRDAAERLAAALDAKATVIEVAGVGTGLLGRGDPAVASAVAAVQAAVLVEPGAICPAQGLYQLDSRYADDDSLAQWVSRWGAAVRAAVRRT
jgi:FMN reductase